MFPAVDELSPLSPVEAHCLITPVDLVGFCSTVGLIGRCIGCSSCTQAYALADPVFYFAGDMSVIIHKVLQTHAGLSETLGKTK